MCVDSPSLFELQVSGGCVHVCMCAYALGGVCAGRARMHMAAKRARERARGGKIKKIKTQVNALILAVWWAGPSSCLLFAEDFQTSSEIITAAVALGSRTAGAACLTGPPQHAHNALTTADILRSGQVFFFFSSLSCFVIPR